MDSGGDRGKVGEGIACNSSVNRTIIPVFNTDFSCTLTDKSTAPGAENSEGFGSQYPQWRRACLKKLSQILTEDKNVFALVPAPPKPVTFRKAKRNPNDPRDYKAEEARAQVELFEAMADYRVQRNTGISPQLIQIAQALILCGLPYRSTDATEHTRVSRASDGSLVRVTFYAFGKDEAGKRVPMAYGADRTFLHWCVDRAIKRKDPFVPLSTASDFMRDTGQKPSGQNYARLRAAFRRVSSMAIVVERHAGAGETRSILPIIAHSHLPQSIQPNGIPIDGPAGIRFGEDFFREINANPVPFPWDVLRALDKKPQMQDYMLFLHWRSFAAKTDTLIPWAIMRDQLWQSDSNPRRIRSRFTEAIKIFRTAWPELNAVADSKGLRIGPPRKGQHLFPSHHPETKHG